MKQALQKKKVADKRYYFHRRLKGKYQIDGAKRTIALPYKAFEEVPIGDRYYIGQLISLGYNIQLNLF